MKSTSSARVGFVTTVLFAFGSATPACRDEQRSKASPTPRTAASRTMSATASQPAPIAAAQNPRPLFGGLTPEEVADYEARLKSHPDDLELRSRLLQHYSRGYMADPGLRAARLPHIFWIIRNRPEAQIIGREARLDSHFDPAGYIEAVKLWDEVLIARGNEPAVLANASQFFLFQDRGRSEELLKKAQELDPTNPEWPWQLGQLYSLSSRGLGGKVDVEAARKSLESYERALAANPGPMRSFIFLNVARAALDAGELDKAQQYANELLASATETMGGWNYGDAVHKGNIVLGHVAFRRDDIAAAEQFLLKAAESPGSTELSRSGPSMSLAKALLEAGRREVVVEYLRVCGNFWKDSKREDWIVLIEGNRMPDFGANLRY